MAATSPVKGTPCDRIFNDGGAHTVRMKNGIAYCTSCGFPVKEHK